MAVRYFGNAKAGADDLEILYPDQTVPVGAQLWTVREYSFIEGARLRSIGESACAALTRGESVNMLELIQLIALATGKSACEVAALPQECWERLWRAWLRVNACVFEAGAPAGKTLRWGDIVARLIAHGHDPRRIGEYTLRQVSLYYECAQRLDSTRSADRIRDVNLGFAGGEGARAAMRALHGS